MNSNQCYFQLFGDLNIFVEDNKNNLVYSFSGTPSIKDCFEALGIPNTEIDVILVNGVSVDFTYLIHGNESIELYPKFEYTNETIIHLKENPPGRARFILDVHLGKLSRRLRLLGFDTLYENNYDDPVIVKIGIEENRIILFNKRQGNFKI